MCGNYGHPSQENTKKKTQSKLIGSKKKKEKQTTGA